MTDILRTRIAAALKDVLGEQVYTVILNAKEPFSMIVDGEVDLLDTADAVIRELGNLRQEPHRFQCGSDDCIRYRIISDWTPNE